MSIYCHGPYSPMRFALLICFSFVFGGCSRTHGPSPDAMQSGGPVSATLSVAAGTVQTITAVFRNAGGGSRIAEVTVSVMSDQLPPGGGSGWSTHECLLRYDVAANEIWLVPDVGGTWGSHSITAGSASTFSNSQCTVLASGSGARISGNLVTVDLALKFTDKFAGRKQIYLESEDADGKWSSNYKQQFGNFTVTASRTP